jgi:tellurite resistance protein
MIIFGSRSVTSTKESGNFTCPGCGGTPQVYSRRVVRRFFTLYFIPILPLGKLGEFYECQHCRNTYNEQVLNFDPAAQQEKSRAEFIEHLKRLMILAALADGRVDPAEIDAIRKTYEGLSGTTLSVPEIEREISLARQAKITPADYTLRFAGNLTDRAKELVIKSVHPVLVADGEMGPDEHDLLNNLAHALDLSGAHFRGILTELGA